MTIETKFGFGDIIEWTGFNQEYHGRVDKVSVRACEGKKIVLYGVTLPNGKWMTVDENSVRPHDIPKQ